MPFDSRCVPESPEKGSYPARAVPHLPLLAPRGPGALEASTQPSCSGTTGPSVSAGRWSGPFLLFRLFLKPHS